MSFQLSVICEYEIGTYQECMHVKQLCACFPSTFVEVVQLRNAPILRGQRMFHIDF